MEQGTDPVGHNILPRNPTTVWLAFAGQSFCCFLLLFVSFYLHCVLHSWSDTFSIGLNLLQVTANNVKNALQFRAYSLTSVGCVCTHASDYTCFH